jgi:putative FmdB family regulatory protein
MPTYDYECQSCGHTFEAFQNMSDPPLKKCPKCSKKVKRLIGGGLGIIFKGSGFYSTDNRNGSSSIPSSEKDSGKSSATTESKPKNETPKKSEPAKT